MQAKYLFIGAAMLGLSLSGHAAYAAAGSPSGLAALKTHVTANAPVPAHFLPVPHGGFHAFHGFHHYGLGHRGYGGYRPGGWSHYGYGGYRSGGRGYGGWGHYGRWREGGWRRHYGWGYGGGYDYPEASSYYDGGYNGCDCNR